jgi:hypothetical protein
MPTVGRLSIIALTVLFVAVALAAGERATALNGVAVPVAPRETSLSPRTPLFPPWPDPDQSASEPDQAERGKAFAWLLLLLKEHRGAR